MNDYVVALESIDRTSVAIAGGKAAALGELSRMNAIHVPRGFCVTTHAFAQVVAQLPHLDAQLERLTSIELNDRQAIQSASLDIRRTIESAAVTDDLRHAITQQYQQLGDHIACAVRSSATAEDLPSASFAGQQDSYLNIAGEAAIMAAVRRCWASLFTERAVMYRMRHRFDHRQVQMAVLVQRMVVPDSAGILFTADPVTGNRKISSIDAGFGLGEAIVSGIANADSFKVRDGNIVERVIARKTISIAPAVSGGTVEVSIADAQQQQPSIADADVLRLAQLGRRIETHFGSPQDIEWCLDASGVFHIVQSRPITTLFPVPRESDGRNHVYLSVGHQQMMTDAMKPLGLSVWQLTTMRPMAEAGGRLFVDVTDQLANAASRAGLLEMTARFDELTRDALQQIVDRETFVPLLSDELPDGQKPPARSPLGYTVTPVDTDAAIVTALIAAREASLEHLKREIADKSGTGLLDFIKADIEEHKRLLFDQHNLSVIMAGMNAGLWLNEHLEQWLGEKNAADVLSQSVENNVTSEMGLALLNVADAIRPHAQAVRFLERIEAEPATEDFLDELERVEGGSESRQAIQQWLDRYGMRGAGEIDITRVRWSEQPAMLVPLILGNIRHFEPGEAKRRFEAGVRTARDKEAELLERLGALPDAAQKIQETKANIDRVRTFAGYREYPKYAKVCRDFVYKRSLMKECARLVHAGVLREAEDAFYLRFEELQELVREQRASYALIELRKTAHRVHETLRPPRVLTSDGEMINTAYRRDNVPAGALTGLAVSSGVFEGRARVVLDMSKAKLEPGDILVTSATDPSWTPLFVAASALVTEVGGFMTHGAVIAREYGLPTVVGVANATQRIADGQRIRVNGTDGYVELLT